MNNMDLASAGPASQSSAGAHAMQLAQAMQVSSGLRPFHRSTAHENMVLTPGHRHRPHHSGLCGRAIHHRGPSTGQHASTGLLIQGYNYTDDYIDSFTADGRGGGNVFVSSPTTGGGKSTCCHGIPSATNPTVAIRWSASYCTYESTNKYGKTYTWRRSIWKETLVPVLDQSSGSAQALEVHFYADGHVEAAITKGNSPPRLNLPINDKEERPGSQHNYPKCQP